MKFEEISLEKALNKEELVHLGIKYGLIYFYHSVVLKRIEDIIFDIDNIIEARLFGIDKEIHIFKEDNLKAIKFEEEKDKDVVEVYLLEERFGELLRVKNYISYDDDGQAFISYTRPFEAEGVK